MEEKNETGQGDKDSGKSQGSDNSSQGSDNSSSTASGNVADKLIADVKKFNMMSLIGLGMAVVFLLFMFFDGTRYKWWLMLPLAGAAAFILYRQLSDTQSFEKKVCFYGLIAIGVLVLLRDIQISNTVEGYRSYGAKFTQLKNVIKSIPIVTAPTK